MYNLIIIFFLLFLIIIIVLKFFLVSFSRPESANTTDFPVEDGDVILMATDGVFDNVPDQLLIPALCTIQGERDPGIIQSVANSICLMARSLALDAEFISPFAQRARENGIDAIGNFYLI